jgi:CheY-like chemotaxis protein
LTASEPILVVEDEPIVRMLVVDYLGELGYDTIEAVDAPSALDVLRGPGAIRLMLTDVGLPGMDGHELAGRARELRPGLKILFATGYGGSDPAMAEAAVVGKPFNIEELAAKIRAMMEG